MDARLKKYFNGKKILIFGGTGSWGSELVRQMIKYYNPEEIRIFSRGEHKQVEMRQLYQQEKNIRFIVGDVRDKEAVDLAMNNIQVVFNLAALKHVPVCEENVWEAIQTNVYGVHNIIASAMKHAVEVVVQVSTDKAVDPLNLYGFTKGCAERLITSANNSPAKPKNTKFVCVRGGNVLSTTGSVVPLFKHLIEKYNKVTITNPDMSRYIMKVEQAINLVLKAILESSGGEIFVMKMPGIKIVDLAKVMVEKLGNSKTKIEISGMRPGEKIYEILVSKNETSRTIQDGDYYIILPDIFHKEFKKDKYKNFRKINIDEYNSLNTHQFSKGEITKILDEDGWLDKEREDAPFSSILSSVD